jgi:putative zinc finger protein
MARDVCVAGEPSPFSLERLSAFGDGDLPSSDLASVRQHLEACAACARRADELGAVARSARALEVPEPPPTLWPAIEGALARERSADRWFSLRHWRPFGIGMLAGVGGAAVIAIVLGAARGGPIATRAPAAAAAPVASSEAPRSAAELDPLLADAEQEFARAAAVYERSIEKLRSLLVREEARWSPEMRARYDERLARLDDAIARSREEARRAPGESEGHEQLFAAYQQKIAFLAETVHRGGGSGPGGP